MEGTARPKRFPEYALGDAYGRPPKHAAWREVWDRSGMFIGVNKCFCQVDWAGTAEVHTDLLDALRRVSCCSMPEFVMINL
jgi:hypothetical protein